MGFGWLERKNLISKRQLSFTENKFSQVKCDVSFEGRVIWLADEGDALDILPEGIWHSHILRNSMEKASWRIVQGSDLAVGMYLMWDQLMPAPRQAQPHLRLWDHVWPRSRLRSGLQGLCIHVSSLPCSPRHLAWNLDLGSWSHPWHPCHFLCSLCTKY